MQLSQIDFKNYQKIIGLGIISGIIIDLILIMIAKYFVLLLISPNHEFFSKFHLLITTIIICFLGARWLAMFKNNLNNQQKLFLSLVYTLILHLLIPVGLTAQNIIVGIGLNITTYKETFFRIYFQYFELRFYIFDIIPLAIFYWTWKKSSKVITTE